MTCNTMLFAHLCHSFNLLVTDPFLFWSEKFYIWKSPNIYCVWVDLKFNIPVLIIDFWWPLLDCRWTWKHWWIMSLSQELLSHHTCSPDFLSDNSKLCWSTKPSHLWTLAIVLYETGHFSKSFYVGRIYLAFVTSNLFFLYCHLMPSASHSIRERIHCSHLSHRT